MHHIGGEERGLLCFTPWTDECVSTSPSKCTFVRDDSSLIPSLNKDCKTFKFENLQRLEIGQGIEGAGHYAGYVIVSQGPVKKEQVLF